MASVLKSANLFTSIYVIEMADTVIYLSKSSAGLSLTETLVIVSSESSDRQWLAMLL